jgi:hypothetical protein
MQMYYHIVLYLFGTLFLSQTYSLFSPSLTPLLIDFGGVYAYGQGNTTNPFTKQLSCPEGV